jgi:hypothetical protein
VEHRAGLDVVKDIKISYTWRESKRGSSEALNHKISEQKHLKFHKHHFKKSSMLSLCRKRSARRFVSFPFALARPMSNRPCPERIKIFQT